MSWAIEISDLPGSDPLGVLSKLAPSPQVSLHFLTQSQVQAFAACYGLLNEEAIGGLWSWFSGQPYLTHVALTRWRDTMSSEISDSGKAWGFVLQEIDCAAGEFGRHVSRLLARLRLCQPFGEGEFDYSRLLAAFGIFDGEGKAIRFYRRHLETLQDFLMLTEV